MEWYIYIISYGEPDRDTFCRKQKRKEIKETKLALHNTELRLEETVASLVFPWMITSSGRNLKHVKKLRSKCFVGLAKLKRVAKLKGL